MTRRSHSSFCVALALQALDDERSVLKRFRSVDERLEALVVPGGGLTELLVDGGILGAGVLPPRVLEVEGFAIEVGELHGVARYGEAPTVLDLTLRSGVMSDEPKTRHIWMPDRRSLCDRRAHPPRRPLGQMSETEFEDYVAEQTSAPACGPCLLVAGWMRRQAGVILKETDRRVHPATPTEAWEQLLNTRWESRLDIEDFLQIEGLDSEIRFEAINDEAAPDVIAALTTDHAAELREIRAAELAATSADTDT